MNGERDEKSRRHKFKIICIVVGILFAILLFKLYYLQVANDAVYASVSDNNRIRIVSTSAARGMIYDANMQVLATSTPVFAIALSIDGLKQEEREQVSQTLSAVLGDKELTADAIMEKIKGHSRTYEPVVIARVSYQEGLQLITQLEEMRNELPGIVILEEPQRVYPQGALAGHIIGTVGLISSDEVDMAEEYGYLLTDWIGKSGLEKTMERFSVNGKEIGLRGTRGIEQVEVNAKHKPVDTISETLPVAGNSLVLTLDADVQRVMEQSMAEIIKNVNKTQKKCNAAAAVLLNVKTGAVIAMASYPQMDPNDFASGLSSDKAKYYYDDKLLPLFNRAISGAYAPGSTFKAATALAIVSSDTVSPQDTVTCSSALWKNPRAKCTRAHGRVNLYSATAVSCNAYFQEMAYRIGEEQLIKVCTQLGLGQKTGINLPGEVAGTLPTPEWKATNFSGWEETWRNYDTFYMSMGQGYNMDTPLQLANYIATIANGGTRYVPYLVDEIFSPEGDLLYTAQPQVTESLSDIPDEDFATVRKAMRAVTEAGGTAYYVFFGFPITVAAKTGTAQTGIVGDDPNKDFNGVFVAFAPYDDPQVAFACVVEYGQAGGNTGGKIARAVFQEYFDLNVEPLPDQLPEAGE